MSVLVTGSAGFIGSHLVDQMLDRGEEVVGFDNFDEFYDRGIKEENLAAANDHDRFSLIEGDVRDRSKLSGLPDSIDTIVHVAARAGVRPSIRDPLVYTDVNIMGTALLLELARERGIRSFVFASSSSVYGNNRKVPFSEKDSVDRPISPYAATKRAGELLCYTQTHLHATSCICLRFFTVYGPRQRPDLAIRKFSRLLLSGQELPCFGDGTTSRDYTFVADIIQGVTAAVDLSRREDRRFEVVNLGESRTVTLSEMIRVIGEVFDRKPRVTSLPAQPGDVERTHADVSKAQEILGYRPSTQFLDGMRAFASWYEGEGARQDGVEVQ